MEINRTKQNQHRLAESKERKYNTIQYCFHYEERTQWLVVCFLLKYVKPLEFYYFAVNANTRTCDCFFPEVNKTLVLRLKSP